MIPIWLIIVGIFSVFMILIPMLLSADDLISLILGVTIFTAIFTFIIHEFMRKHK